VKIVLGIGNPGREHARTRHNAGWRVVDLVASRAGLERWRRRFAGLVGEVTLAGERVLLVKPETFVNLSGECARAAVDYTGAGPGSLLVVCDDANLPLGVLRCRPGGSSGGHKGLDSIAAHLGTESFARLRIGVGRPAGGGDLAPHVLGTFSSEEEPLAMAAEARAADAVLEWVGSGIEMCMNKFNGPVRPAGDGRDLPGEGEQEEP